MTDFLPRQTEKPRVLILVSGATATMDRLNDPRFGTLVVPGAGNAPEHLRLAPGRWAMDNGAFAGFKETPFRRMLDRFVDESGCLFVTAPDVVAQADDTLRLFDVWQPRLRRYDYPIASVAQDGLTVGLTPWQRLDVLFIGGSTEFKWSREAATLCAYAKARGKGVHIGRVNSLQALRRARRRGWTERTSRNGRTSARHGSSDG